MRLTLTEAKAILQKEIEWCLDNPDNDLNRDQQSGFMNGLRQAQHLIEQAEMTILATTPKEWLDVHPRLRPLANIAMELRDDEIQDVVQYVAYLNYRRRIFKMAAEERDKILKVHRFEKHTEVNDD